MPHWRQTTLHEYFLVPFPPPWLCLYQTTGGQLERPCDEQWNHHLFEVVTPLLFRRRWYGDAQCVCGCIDYPQFVAFEMRYPDE